MTDREWLTERVLRAVEQIPVGRVASYGLIGEVAGAGPRQVGAILARVGASVCWWRVTNCHGDLPAGLLARAMPRWVAEGIAVKPNGRGCRYDHYGLSVEDFDSVRWVP